MPELGRGRLADQHGTGPLQARHRGGILLGHVVLVHVGGEGGAHALGVDQILHMERHAVQGPEGLPLGDGGIGGGGIAQGFLTADGDEAIESGVGPLGTRQGCTHDLRRGHPLRPDHARQLGGGGIGEIAGGHA